MNMQNYMKNCRLNIIFGYQEDKNMFQQSIKMYRCAICKQNIPEEMTFGIGDIPLCFQRLYDA